ncbi:helix-turn-helix domain-containing protein [Solicola sp. PLA-1-18]|uniref:helix-turn-helix domain-containing protein n=1 Tax=Solicola sp. PLA-1-18 TaxID=3380532 RepID=UPI003B821B3D
MPVVSTSSEPDLFTPREVADLFGVDRKTVTRWAKTGRLPTVRTRVANAGSPPPRSTPC